MKKGKKKRDRTQKEGDLGKQAAAQEKFEIGKVLVLPVIHKGQAEGPGAQLLPQLIHLVAEGAKQQGHTAADPSVVKDCVVTARCAHVGNEASVLNTHKGHLEEQKQNEKSKSKKRRKRRHLAGQWQRSLR